MIQRSFLLPLLFSIHTYGMDDFKYIKTYKRQIPPVPLFKQEEHAAPAEQAAHSPAAIRQWCIAMLQEENAWIPLPIRFAPSTYTPQEGAFKPYRKDTTSRDTAS